MSFNTVISIDVGIKNLALCMFKRNGNGYSIAKWDVINLTTSAATDSTVLHVCCCKDKKGNPCKIAAKFTTGTCAGGAGGAYCPKHAKEGGGGCGEGGGGGSGGFNLFL